MPRIDLRVPFNEKDEARRLGARWDPRQKLWYVPTDVDPAPLQKWCPSPWTPNVSAERYYFATSTRQCWKCAASTRVFAIVLPEGHETFYVGDDPAEDHWQMANEPTLLSYVKDLPAPVAAQLKCLTQHYRLGSTETSFYWMNHCEHCTAKLGDFETVQEYAGPFSPTTTEEAAMIYLDEVIEPFSASCGGYTLGLEWFVDAQHRPFNARAQPARAQPARDGRQLSKTNPPSVTNSPT